MPWTLRASGWPISKVRSFVARMSTTSPAPALAASRRRWMPWSFADASAVGGARGSAAASRAGGAAPPASGGSGRGASVAASRLTMRKLDARSGRLSAPTATSSATRIDDVPTDVARPSKWTSVRDVSDRQAAASMARRSTRAVTRR